ncbi:MAG: hypothetical protein EA369_00190 [Bradymonadales bacterium]|nr:MAG: hypothetical protein EA369_00190 [Bradymonadales bacterium]
MPGLNCSGCLVLLSYPYG